MADIQAGCCQYEEFQVKPNSLDYYIYCQPALFAPPLRGRYGDAGSSFVRTSRNHKYTDCPILPDHTFIILSLDQWSHGMPFIDDNRTYQNNDTEKDVRESEAG